MANALGIDTGGTYTDAVLVEYGTNRVLASAKALTTKHDLAIGIREAIRRALSAQPTEVHLVSLSTTLATNAIVEGQGAPICVLLIGYSGRVASGTRFDQELGTNRYALIAGGHTVNGEEVAPLDLDAARQAILEHAAHVSAFAISGFFGTRNPAHEIAVRRLVAELTDLPATCGHELTHKLDAIRRATTVALNARLIPLICNLIDAVEDTMSTMGIVAPLMVVKGDGSLVEASLAKERPIETILSGPAASVVGAQHLAQSSQEEGADGMLVVDMGGTTTDIAVIRDGSPQLSRQGARVGNWRTMVEAIDVHTAGLGGDSQVWIDSEPTLRVGPRRIVPICLLASEHPHVRHILEQQVKASSRSQAPQGEFLVLQNPSWPRDGNAPGFEAEMVSALQQGPCSLARIYEIMRYPSLYARYLAQLERRGVVVRSGLTPTDAAHVMGLYDTWDRDAALLAARLFGRRTAQDAESLCAQIISDTSKLIATEIIAKLLADGSRNGDEQGLADSELIARALRPSPGSPLACALTVRPVLVAVGAPVRTYFPAVAEHLHGRLRIPEHTEVANAIGAVAGSVVSRIHVIIVPGDEGTVYRVHLPDEVQVFGTLQPALAYGERRARDLALEGARRAGAEDIRLSIERHDSTAPVAGGWGEMLYLQTSVDATAIGRPRLAVL